MRQKKLQKEYNRQDQVSIVLSISFVFPATPNKTNSAISKNDRSKTPPDSVYSKGYKYKRTSQDRKAGSKVDSKKARKGKSPAKPLPKQLKKSEVQKISEHWDTDEEGIREILSQYI